MPANVPFRCKALELAKSTWIAVYGARENIRKIGVRCFAEYMELKFLPKRLSLLFRKWGWPYV